MDRMRGSLLDGAPVEAVPDEGAHDCPAAILHLRWVARVLLHVSGDLGRVAVAPVGEVKRDEYFEVDLLGSLVCEGELRRGVLVNAGAIECECIDPDGLCGFHVGNPVFQLIILDDADLSWLALAIPEAQYGDCSRTMKWAKTYLGSAWGSVSPTSRAGAPKTGLRMLAAMAARTTKDFASISGGN